METVGKSNAGNLVSGESEEDLQLLYNWSDPERAGRYSKAAVLSILVHIGAIAFLIYSPETLMQPGRPRQMESVVTPLIAPLTILTQKAPNTEKPGKTFDATDLEPRPRVKAPPGPPPAPAPPPRQAEVAPPKPVTPPLPEPPKIEATVENPKLTLPMPQIQAEEKKSPFEDVTAPRRVPPDQRVLPIPGPTVENAIRGAIHGSGSGSNLNIPPQTRPGSSELPQLLSDPQGVDFRPYLAQILAAVKNSWYAVMPKQGVPGTVSLQVEIMKDGSVGKVVYTTQTGIAALDRAPVVAVSAAAPFPQLPAAYRGSDIRVQFNFAYNVPRQ